MGQYSFKLPMAAAALLTTLTWLSPTTVEAEQGAGAIEEIIVTSQRREESVQSVPIAVTAFSGEDLEQMGIVDIKGITERTPGFTMGVFNGGQPQYYIRGIGSNEDGAGGDQSVIVFIDEVYIGRSAGSDLDLFDLERVEVLRGPQGTLFGKNVVGGAVSLITKKPTEEKEIVLQGSYGNLNALTLRGLASGPLSDNVFGKVSFSSRKRDGYMKSQIDQFPEYFPGTSGSLLGKFDQHDIDSDSVRAGLRFLPSDRLEINLTANYSTVDQAGPSRKHVGPGGFYYLPDAALLPNYDDDIHENLVEDPGFWKSDIWGVTGRIDWDFNDTMTFTSLTSYREVDSDMNWSIATENVATLRVSTGTVPLAVYGSNDYVDDSETFTQEFRLTSSGSGPLQWVGGLYYMQEETYRDETVPAGLLVSDGADGSIILVPAVDAGDKQDNTTDSYAIFGQVTWDITDKLAITAGGRQTWEEKKISRLGTPNGLAPARDFQFTTSEDWSAFTAKGGIEYQATDDLFFYATVSEGFKSGGYQGTAATELAAITPFEPEEAVLYEVGAKTEWFNNRLRLNLAVFHTDYKDLQILQLLEPEGSPIGTPGQLVTQNAADAEIRGAELEFTIVPLEGLTLSGSYTYLDTEFSNFFIPDGFRPPGGVDPADSSREGNDLRNAPEHAFNILARYELFLDGGASLAFQADYRYKDKVYQDPDLLEEASVPSYDVMDLTTSYTFPSGNVELTGWIRNLFDEEYFLHNFPISGSGAATPAPPRTYGITVTWRNNGG